MQQIWIPRTGPPGVLEVREAPEPEPAAGEARISVEAAGVNFADLMTRMGLYPDAPPLPVVVGYEVAGTVDAVGQGMDPGLVGTPVVAMTRFGGYSSSVLVKEEQLAKRPPGLDAVTAAAIPVTGLTAWMMLEEMGRVREGDRVLVHSAGGGVGLMALDLIKRRRAIAIGTASGSKHNVLEDRGYDKLIDYQKVDFYEALKDQPGLDLILDAVGGASWSKDLRLLRPGGRLICFGLSASAKVGGRSLPRLAKTMASVPWLKVNPISLMNGNKGVMGVNMGRMWNEAGRVTAWLNELLALWADGVIRPAVHSTVPFDNAKEAHRILHDRENLGKVILTP